MEQTIIFTVDLNEIKPISLRSSFIYNKHTYKHPAWLLTKQMWLRTRKELLGNRKEKYIPQYCMSIGFGYALNKVGTMWKLLI